MRRAAAAAAFALFIVAGCAVWGQGDAGPAPLDGTRLYVDADGRTMHTTMNCGGALSAAETDAQVVVTYTRPNIPPGAASCALVRIAVTLKRPLQSRLVLDGVNRKPVGVFALTALDRLDSRDATAAGPPTWSAGLACAGLEGASVVESPCGAQDYHVIGQPLSVTLIQALSIDPTFWYKPPTPQSPPWCLRLSSALPPDCGTVVCQPVAGAVTITACQATQGRYGHYLTWLLGPYRLYLTSSRLPDPTVLTHLALSVTASTRQGPP